jgi:hypothetical protein
MVFNWCLFTAQCHPNPLTFYGSVGPSHAGGLTVLLLVWLGWAYLAKIVRKQQRGGVNFDPPMIFCACSMQNTPGASEILQDDFRAK